MKNMTSFLNLGLLCLVLSHVAPEGAAEQWGLIASIALLLYLVTSLLSFVSWMLARKLAAMNSNTSFFAEVLRDIRNPTQ